MDKVTLDFENNIIIWETDTQQGTEYCPELSAKKAAIMAAMGYTAIDLSKMVKAFTDYMNGQISAEELEHLLDQEARG